MRTDRLARPLFRSIASPADAVALWLAIRCLLLVAVNALFLTGRPGDNLLPKSVVVNALRAGCADGSTSPLFYPNNRLIGRDMYNDYLVTNSRMLQF